MRRSSLTVLSLGLLSAVCILSAQQDQAPPPSQNAPPGPEYPAQQYPSQQYPSQQPPSQQLSPQQLDDLVAPIALYPDPLLSEILAASTYPLEIVEAQQWLRDNPKLKGKKLMEKAQHQNWDPSVQALVAFPDVLARLTQDERWTTDLGNAFLSQQADVMAAVQRMRARAQANGKLQSTPQETVTTATQNGQSAIEILPPNPGTIYVPSYNPDYVWGPPVVGYYPPLPYPPVDVGFSFFPGVDLGLYFGGGWGLWGGYGWGWGPNWFGGNIFVNPFFFHRFGFGDFHGGFGPGNAWFHNPGHRLGVPYPNRGLAGRFGAGEGFGRPGEVRGNAFARGPDERFGSQGFERQNPAGNRSVFGGAHNSSGFTRMQSDHGFSSMGHAGFGGGFGGRAGGFGGGHAGGFGGGHAGGGGRR